MKALRLVGVTFRLLDRRNQGFLAIITLVQMTTGFLDLAGVLLLGFVSVVSVAVVSDSELPSQFQNAVSFLSLGDLPPLTLAAWLFGLAALLLVLKSIISVLLSRLTLRFLAHRQAEMSARLARDLLSRSLLEIQRRASQDVAFSISVGTQAAMVGVLGAASTAAADIALLLILGAGLFFVDPQITLFAILYFGLIAFFLQRSLSKWAAALGEISTSVDIASYTAIQEAIASYREIFVMHRRRNYVDRVQDLRWKSAIAGADSQLVGLVPKYVFEVALVLGGAGLAASQLAVSGLASAIGIVAVFLVAGARVMPALLRLQTTVITIRRSEAAAQKAITLMDELAPRAVNATDRETRNDEEGYDLAQAGDDTQFTPSLDVQDLSLTYPGSQEAALDDVSFAANPGTSVALVGATGAGKSSLADLILGVVDPDKGRVLISGCTPVSAISRWPGSIGYVPQQVSLVNGSIRENVGLGLNPDEVSDTEVWEALEIAQLSQYLDGSREGLDTLVGEAGIKLSGGQRQRLGLARALMTKPKMIVLDEATSALDSETEAAISGALRSLHGEVTTVTVAHRLATVKDADLVLFLEHGIVKGRGSFESVREQSPAFNRQANLLGL